MSTLKAFKAAITVGMTIEILDHWRRSEIGLTRHVVKVERDGYYYTRGGKPEGCWAEFPEDSELTFADGVATLDDGRRHWKLRLKP